MPYPKLPPRIYLTGFMGSGKSTIGLVLAQRLGYDFIDLDATVEEVVQKSIAAVFEEDGEAVFRAHEAAALGQTTSRDHVVVAVGGGALLDGESLQLAKSAGIVVYLQLDAKRLAGRLRVGASRPLLRGADGEVPSDSALLARTESLLAERAPFYEQADATVDVSGLLPDAAADAIMDALRARV